MKTRTAVALLIGMPSSQRPAAGVRGRAVRASAHLPKTPKLNSLALPRARAGPYRYGCCNLSARGSSSTYAQATARQSTPPSRVIGPSASRDPMVPIGLARHASCHHHITPVPASPSSLIPPMACCAWTGGTLLQGRVCAAICMTPSSAGSPCPTPRMSTLRDIGQATPRHALQSCSAAPPALARPPRPHTPSHARQKMPLPSEQPTYPHRSRAHVSRPAHPLRLLPRAPLALCPRFVNIEYCPPHN